MKQKSDLEYFYAKCANQLNPSPFLYGISNITFHPRKARELEHV